MKRCQFIAVLLGFMAFVAFANNASAYYHPGMGRFLSRDPGPARVGSGGMAAGGHFVQREPYAEGMNLYQYAGSNPVTYVDPNGLQKVIAIVNGQDFWGIGNGGTNEGYSVCGTFKSRFSGDNYIVKCFEEDADWSSPRASNWIDSQQKNTPNKDKPCNPHSVVIIGHSNGADAAVKIAKQLSQRNYDIQLLALFDPIGKPWHPGPNGIVAVSSNIKDAINYHQRVATFQVLFFKLQGYQISGGKNVEWRPTPTIFADLSWDPHITIPDIGKYPSGKLYQDEVVDKVEALNGWQ